MDDRAVGQAECDVDARTWPHPARELIEALSSGGAEPMAVARDPERWRRVSELVAGHAESSGPAGPAAPPELAEVALRTICALSRCLWEEGRFVDGQWLLLKALTLAKTWGCAAGPVVGDIHRHLEGLYEVEAERYKFWATEVGTAADEIRLDDHAVSDGFRSELRDHASVALRTQAFWGAHEVALRAHQLGKLLADDERFEDATALYERALALRSQLLESARSEVAKTAHNLALLYERAGRGEAAHSLWERVGSVLGSPPEGLAPGTRG